MSSESHAPAVIATRRSTEERRNLSKYDRSALVLQLEPLYAAEAKRVHDANGGDLKSPADSDQAPEPEKGRTAGRHQPRHAAQIAALKRQK